MTGAEELREKLAEYLRSKGLQAVAAWAERERARAGTAVVAVSLRGRKGGPAGFQDYLGERYNEERGGWEELFGKRVELTFGLDLYAATAHEAQKGLDELALALGEGGPEGLRPVAFSAGETVYRGEDRRYFCPAQAEFEGWSYAVRREDGTFMDFIVEGEKQG